MVNSKHERTEMNHQYHKSLRNQQGENSSCDSKSVGGDLGIFGPGKMVQEFDDALFPDEVEKEPPVGAIVGPVINRFWCAPLFQLPNVNPTPIKWKKNQQESIQMLQCNNYNNEFFLQYIHTDEHKQGKFQAHIAVKQGGLLYIRTVTAKHRFIKETYNNV